MKFLVTVVYGHNFTRTTYTDLDMNTQKGIEDFRVDIANKNGRHPMDVNILYIKELKS